MKSKLTLMTIAIAVLAAGCGGGGGSSNSGPVAVTPAPTTPTTPTTPTPDPSAPQTTPQTPTYTAGSIAQSAFATLNQARTAYGVGLAIQQSQLDTAAANHANYIGIQFQAGNYNAATHSEDPAKPGFTGVTAQDRVAYAKYAAMSSSESLSSVIAVDGVASDPGVVSITGLLSAPYHRFGLFEGYREIGIGHNSQRLPNEGGVRNTVVFNVAIPQSQQAQAPAADWIGAWPVDGATNVLYSFSGESPDPIPSLNGACAGYPVSLQVRSGQVLSTTTFTLVETASGAPVSVQLSTAQNDANPDMARTNTAYIIPYKPLKLATKYTAHFVGSRNGVAIDKTWTFTTQADNAKMIFGCDPS